MMKLSKLKMPKKRMEEMGPSEDELAGLEHGESMPESDELGAENMEASEAVADQPAEPSKLEAISDDDLMAEIKKRGLLNQLEEGQDEAEESNEEELV